MSRIMVTGATGFIGSELIKVLNTDTSRHVTAVVRNLDCNEQPGFIAVGCIDGDTNYSTILSDIDVVIHVAARAHVMSDPALDPLTEYMKVNFHGTINLAQQAATAGVKRFVFVSSIKVNGESTTNIPFTAKCLPAPEDAYGASKLAAEEGLRQLAIDTGMDVVIIRPTLVYGPGVKGNFSTLIRLACRGLPLPLGAIHNRRSMVALDNLIDLIITCIDRPNAANQTFLVSDDQDVSTTELLQKMTHAFGKKARLIPIPMSWICGVASLLGRRAVADRLCGSLQVDITHTKETLGWKPPVTMEQQLAKIAASMQLSSWDV